jgi:hypothetical protein
MVLEIVLKDPFSLNYSHSKLVTVWNFIIHKSFLSCKSITKSVLFHFTWNKLNVHLDSIDTEVIKPGSTVSEIVLANNKSRVYQWQISAVTSMWDFPGETLFLSWAASPETEKFGFESWFWHLYDLSQVIWILKASVFLKNENNCTWLKGLLKKIKLDNREYLT